VVIMIVFQGDEYIHFIFTDYFDRYLYEFTVIYADSGY
jgi:hypothetical protein